MILGSCTLNAIQTGLNCASDWLGYGRYCYLFKIKNINRENALSSCVINGGSLLSIEDSVENDFIKKQLQIRATNKRLWIGLNDIGTEGMYKWTDNTNYGFTDWQNNEPNNAGTEDCVEIVTVGWNDLPCVVTLDGYVCKCRGQDINECISSNGNTCSANAVCNSFAGGYNCKCKNGFSASDSGIESLFNQCLDINECISSTGNTCSANAVCNNFVGGYNCTCKRGFNTSDGGIESLSNQCLDINECNSSNGNRCSANSVCNNFVGGYNCTCKSGFNTSDGGIESLSNQCLDINECNSSSSNNCSANATCNNFISGYNCTCKSGFNTSDGGIESISNQCYDINECENWKKYCNWKNHDCFNTIGSYICTCKSGWILGENNESCIDINECENSNKLCNWTNHDCKNTDGSFICTCLSGWKLDENNDSCVDIDECENSNKYCNWINHVCLNTNGSYICTCMSGWTLGENNDSCVDIDECKSLSKVCNSMNYCVNNICNSTNNVCVNNVGSYECTKGEWSTWSECSKTCGPGYQYSVLNKLLSFEQVTQRQSCINIPCPVDGFWSNWVYNDSCSNLCGHCLIRKERYCNNPAPADGGLVCFGISVQYFEKNTLCQVNGEWTQWSTWSLCSKPCEDGIKTRYRSCTNPVPKFGGLQCNGNNTEESTCNSNECKQVSVSFAIVLSDEDYIAQYSNPTNQASLELNNRIENAMQKFHSKLNVDVPFNLIINSLKDGEEINP